MSDTATYSVILSGSIKSGFKPDQVVRAFAKLFNLPPKRAASMLGKPLILKKQLKPQAAKQYAIKLSQIGLEVVVKRDDGIATTQQRRNPAPSGQPVPKSQPLTVKVLLAPVVMAILGGVMWYLIAVKVNYELGLLAWFIGGGIGMAAMVSGSYSHKVGLICSVLVIASVLGGKYMAATVYQSEVSEFLDSTSTQQTVDFRSIYKEEMKDARAFARVANDDDDLKHYMAMRGYSEFIQASEVTEEELASFREQTAPRMKYLAANNLTFEEWQVYTLGTSMSGMTPMDLLIGSFSLFDLLFFVLGIGTAYLIATGIKPDPRQFIIQKSKLLQARVAAQVPGALRAKLARLRN